jgi:cupin fold WbuC family metalloprotein
MEIIEIKFKKKILGRIIKNFINNKGIKFFSKKKETLQVGHIGYEKNHRIKAHYHPSQKKGIKINMEVLFIVSGKIEVIFFQPDINNLRVVKKCLVKKNELLTLFGTTHGFNILSKNTKMIEIKQGPFVPHKDKVLFDK